MRLRNIDFGHVFNSSGARGFHGEGYWFHKWVPGLNYEGSTFVAKTTTLRPRKGNMPLGPDGSPIDLFPDCIVVKMAAGVTLNSVGLSGPGAEPLLTRWRKEAPNDPFVVSFMSVATTSKERLQEAKEFFGQFATFLRTKGNRPIPGRNVGLQINFSCPNVGLNTTHLLDEVTATLDESQKLDVATMVKLNALVSVEAAHLMTAHAGCDAIVMSNTIPWGQLPDRIDWKGLFGSETSPIAKYGGGGLSGRPLLPIVTDWIRKARTMGINKPIVGGGGILSKEDAGRMLDAGASAIELGSVSILRPWRVQGIIRYVNARLSTPNLSNSGAN